MIATQTSTGPLLKLAEAAERLNVSPRTIQRMAAEQVLTKVRIRGAVRYREQEIEALVRRQAG